MPDFDDRLTDLEQKVQALTENQEAIVVDVARLPESLVLNFRILARNLDAKFAAQDRRIDAKFAEQDRKIDARFAIQDRKIDALAADVGDIKTDLTAVLRILGEHFKPKS